MHGKNKKNAYERRRQLGLDSRRNQITALSCEDYSKTNRLRERIVKLVNLQHLGVKNFSEYQAAKWLEEHEKELIPTSDTHLLGRTKTDLLYAMKKTVKRQIYESRLAALIALKTGKPVTVWDHVLTSGDKTYKTADRVHSKEELAWHAQRGEVISLTKTTLCPYFKLDTETIRQHYNTFSLPKWFEPYTKQRHFRYRLLNAQWEFQKRLYNANFGTSTSKLKRDIRRYNDKIIKAYFSLGRFLNPKRERHGTARPLKIYYVAFDIDGKDHKVCKIESTGVCNDCMVTAVKKLHAFREAITAIKGLKIENVLYSGTKGFHVHCSVNGKRETDLKTFTLINRYLVEHHPGLIDNFTFQDQYGDWQYDTHRIFKIPNSVDCVSGVLCSETFNRLDVKDTLVMPK